MITFRVDGRSGVPPYPQIVQQVRQALRMGVLSVGDQLPTVREVVAAVAVNPNTVLKAYRDLEREGLVEARAGQGTFVKKRAPVPAAGGARRAGARRVRRRTGCHRAFDGSAVALLAHRVHRERHVRRPRRHRVARGQRRGARPDFAWAQSVTRARWLLVKVGWALLGAAAWAG